MRTTRAVPFRHWLAARVPTATRSAAYARRHRATSVLAQVPRLTLFSTSSPQPWARLLAWALEPMAPPLLAMVWQTFSAESRQNSTRPRPRGAHSIIRVGQQCQHGPDLVSLAALQDRRLATTCLPTLCPCVRRGRSPLQAPGMEAGGSVPPHRSRIRLALPQRSWAGASKIRPFLALRPGAAHCSLRRDAPLVLLAPPPTRQIRLVVVVLPGPVGAV